MIKSNIIMKVKSTLIRWGMYQGATIVEKFGVQWIMKTIDFSPGYQLAKLIDSKDKRSFSCTNRYSFDFGVTWTYSI